MLNCTRGWYQEWRCRALLLLREREERERRCRRRPKVKTVTDESVNVHIIVQRDAHFLEGAVVRKRGGVCDVQDEKRRVSCGIKYTKLLPVMFQDIAFPQRHESPPKERTITSVMIFAVKSSQPSPHTYY